MATMFEKYPGITRNSCTNISAHRGFVYLGKLSNALDSKIIIKTETPCENDQEHADASTEGRIGSPICISAKNLRRYPTHSLKNEIAALLLHEAAHQFGFDENRARKLQVYALRKLQVFELHEAASDLFWRTSGWLRAKKYTATPDLCMSAGKLVGMARLNAIQPKFLALEMTNEERARFRKFRDDDSLNDERPTDYSLLDDIPVRCETSDDPHTVSFFKTFAEFTIEKTEQF